MMYAMMPKPTEATVPMTQRMRTSVGSMLKWRARPPQTPAIFLSDDERKYFLGAVSVIGILPNPWNPSDELLQRRRRVDVADVRLVERLLLDPGVRVLEAGQ